MLERFSKKGRELNQTIKDYGEVQPGDKHFAEVSRLKVEQVEISAAIRTRILIMVTTLFATLGVGGGAAYLASKTDGGGKRSTTSPMAPYMDSKAAPYEAPGRDSVTVVVDGDPASSIDVSLWRQSDEIARRHLHGRTNKLLRKYLPSEDAQRVLGELFSSDEDKKVLDLLIQAHNKLRE